MSQGRRGKQVLGHEGEAPLPLLGRCLEAAEAVIAVGSCASFGGLTAAAHNPTGAMGIGELMAQGLVPRRILINLSGCPPLPEVLGATLPHRVAFGHFPELDGQNRPRVFYGATVHDRCPRRSHFEAGRFARSFHDQGTRDGWCLLQLGCKGQVTHNTCAARSRNGVSSPIEAGHPCIGCSEPGFWDRGGLYFPTAIATPEGSDPAERGATLADLASQGVPLHTAGIWLRDQELLHALRDSKAGDDHALPLSVWRDLPRLLETAQPYLDTAEQALVYAFDAPGGTGKVVIRVNYSAKVRQGVQRERVRANFIRTGGMVEFTNLDVGSQYRRLKK